MAALIALPLLTALVFSGLGLLLRFGRQKAIERFFHAASDQFLDLPLDYFLII